MKFAICQELFVGWEWERQCRFIAETGYTGVEVAPFTLASRITEVSSEQRRTIRAVAESQGLTICGLHWLLAKTEGLHLTEGDSAVHRATAQYLIELGNACADLGGTVLVFGSPLQRNLKPGMTKDQGLGNAAAVFRDVMPVLAERGVRIAIEPLAPSESNFINTCEEAFQLIERIDHPLFVLHQDVRAMLSESKPIPDLILQYASVTEHFHVNDGNLLGPGMGVTDYRPIFDALLQSRYSGWVSVEVFDDSPGAERIARDSLRYMRDVLRDLGAPVQ
ncbi:MAG: sugar phosphate isomerase/epimerase [Planctomycetales bacterium]|nr:sugar phosphate isomerase/epimerase [Planctomycetales bacterium]